MQTCHWSQEADASGLSAQRDAGSSSPAALHVTYPQSPRTPQSQASFNSHRRLHRKSRMSLTLAGHLPPNVREHSCGGTPPRPHSSVVGAPQPDHTTHPTGPQQS